MSRRRLLADLGRFTLGAVVLGGAVVACRGEDDQVAPGSDGGTTGPGWARVELGFVSAYVLVSNGEAVVIDTGVEGSQEAIEATLEDLGSSWADVGHVILTHKHPDHVGSLAAVAAATEAALYAGAEDIPAIGAELEITPVGDGDAVAALEIIATPGHTPGHISVLDPDRSVLFAGDALNGEGGDVVGPNPEFSEAMDEAWESVAKLAGLEFDTVVFGHGDPVQGGAAAAVASLERG